MPEQIYLLSEEVNVFPSVHRGEENSDLRAKSRLFTESNLVNIINQLIDEDSFVITSNYVKNESIEFNIAGYYFKITSTANLLSKFGSSSSIYANIKISAGELQGIDEDSKYKGLYFTETKDTSDTTTHSLQILYKVPGTTLWNVPAESRLKFRNGSLKIDGGEI